MDLLNKVVLVTGSGGGIGYGIAEALAKKGAKIVISDIVEAKVIEAVEKIKKTGAEATGIVTDVSKESSVEELFAGILKIFGRLDISVLNAGILRDGLLIKTDRETGEVKSKMSLDQWQSVINVNLTGVFLTGRESAVLMAKTGGLIIPIASVSMHGNPGQTNYSAAKAGVAAMTKLWAHELSRYKIRVAGIAPGFIATEMVLKDMNAQALEKWQKLIPIGRLGEVSEIAATAVFIAECDLITGVVLEASGGIKI